MNDTAEAEHAKDDICAPLDVLECGWNEICKREVEDPVRSCSETDALCTVLQRENLGDENPCTGSPCQAVESDKDVTACNDTGSIATVYLPFDVVVSSNIGNGVTAGGHQASNSEVEGPHSYTTIDEQRATTKSVDEAESDGCGDQEDNVLDG